jgi:SAM-dependent methyltransferase
MSSDVGSWVGFWAQPHAIYVNDRHFDVHYRNIAERIIALLPRPDARVLDYGCGEAIHADRVAARAARLLLCESSEIMRDKLAERFAGTQNIDVVEPASLEQLPAASLDLIVANSVVQYLSAAELDRLLVLWRRLLAPDGVLVIGDVIPPNVGPLHDAAVLLRFAAQQGFLLAAMSGLVRTALSPYRKLRSQLGIASYTDADFSAKLRAAGFVAERLRPNLEHNQARMSFRARPVPA